MGDFESRDVERPGGLAGGCSLAGFFARHHLALKLFSGTDFWCKLMCGPGPGDLGGPGGRFSQTTFRYPILKSGGRFGPIRAGVRRGLCRGRWAFAFSPAPRILALAQLPAQLPAEQALSGCQRHKLYRKEKRYGFCSTASRKYKKHKWGRDVEGARQRNNEQQSPRPSGSRRR